MKGEKEKVTLRALLNSSVVQVSSLDLLYNYGKRKMLVFFLQYYMNKPDISCKLVQPRLLIVRSKC